MTAEDAGDRRRVLVEDPADLLEEVDQGEHRPGAGDIHAAVGCAGMSPDPLDKDLRGRPTRVALTGEEAGQAGRGQALGLGRCRMPTQEGDGDRPVESAEQLRRGGLVGIELFVLPLVDRDDGVSPDHSAVRR